MKFWFGFPVILCPFYAQLLALGANMYYTEMYLAMIGFSLVSFVFMGVLNIGHVLDVGFELWEFSTFLYSNASLMMLVTIYSIAGSLVWLRLWALNSVMEYYFEENLLNN